MTALASVDVGEELASFFCGDAFQRDPVGALAVQVVVLDAVVRGLASYAFRISIILGEDSALQVVLDLCDPTCSLMS